METGERRAVWIFFLSGPTCQGSLRLTPNRLWMEGYTGHRKKMRGHTRATKFFRGIQVHTNFYKSIDVKDFWSITVDASVWLARSMRGNKL